MLQLRHYQRLLHCPNGLLIGTHSAISQVSPEPTRDLEIRAPTSRPRQGKIRAIEAQLEGSMDLQHHMPKELLVT